MRTNKDDVDAYIETLPTDQAENQTVIRDLIKNRFDREVEESMLFSVPTYHIRGKMRFSVQTAFHYTALYLYDRSLLESFCDAFNEYQSGRNCIRIKKTEDLNQKINWILTALQNCLD